MACDGNTYLAETGGTIHQVSRDGVLSTITSGLGYPFGLAMDSNNNILVALFFSHTIISISRPNGDIGLLAGTTNGFSGDSGLAVTAQLSHPHSVVVDACSRSIFVTDTNNNCIRRIDFNGIIHSVFSFYSFAGPNWIEFDAFGNAYIPEINKHVVTLIDTAGLATRFAGTGSAGYGGDGGPASSALLWNPRGLALAADGRVFIAERFYIREVSSAGIISTLITYVGRQFQRVRILVDGFLVFTTDGDFITKTTNVGTGPVRHCALGFI